MIDIRHPEVDIQATEDDDSYRPPIPRRGLTCWRNKINQALAGGHAA
jgi:hypothetical protein